MNLVQSRRVRLRWIVLVAAIAAIVPAAPASAHSTQIATEPSRDAVVEHAPDRVLLRFDEAVESQVGSIREYDGEPGRQPSGIAAQVLEGTDLTVSVFYLGGRFVDFLLVLWW